MSFSFPRREDDDLGPPPPPFRIRRQRREFRSFGPYNRYILFGVGLLVTFIVLNTLKSLYVDWLWFDGAGYRSVYSKRLATEAWLFGGGALLFIVYFGINTFWAARPLLRQPLPNPASDEEAATVRRVYLLALIVTTLFLAVVMGTIAAVQWDTVLAWMEGEPFGMKDPQFGRDVGFYVFDLPALRFFYGWLMGLAIVTVLAAAGLYLYRFLTFGPENETAQQSRRHLAMLLAIVVALFIWRYWLNRFELNFSENGVVFGATYTDVHARLPLIYLGMALAGLTSLALLAAAAGRSIMIPVAAAGVWAAVTAIGGIFYPYTVQRYSVDPNEPSQERPYIERNIAATRFAFGLDELEERPFPAADVVTDAEIADNPETIQNIRLLDVRPLLQTYAQIQSIRPLYRFLDVDIDRYVINGLVRQVMIAPRELDPNLLPTNAQSWVNKHIQFTHGYGIVVSPVNEVVQEGLPNLFVRDIPVTGNIPVSRPEIYYGEQPDHYVIVKTNDREFDYPIGEGSAQTVFEGDGGVHIGSFFKRALLAWEFGDLNVLISDTLTDDSRLLWRRNIADRVKTLAPFLHLDYDPYIVVSDGKLYWIQDAYTYTDRIPYSQPESMPSRENKPAPTVNYVRNSVKVVVDAYDGTTTFYQVDDEDPIIRTYAKIFPKLFTPIEQMPAGLQAHLRYPEDLFLTQVNKYRTYHITDPGGLYNREDIWNIPMEVFDGQNVPVEPYYVIMRLPGEPEEEFVLIMPLTPARRENTIAWVAARSDPANYGKLVSFRFPTNSLVFGPRQVESRIDQDPTISAQFNLWDQGGSNVIRGNLLMIPIGNGNLFVEPIYLQAQSSQLPELKRVVVVNGNRIAMEPTLDRALAVVFGQAPPTGLEGGGPSTPPPGPPTLTPTAGPAAPSATPAPPPVAGSAAELSREANAAFQRAQEALQRGDFAAYGAEIARVEQLIQQLVQVTGGQ